MVGLKKFLTGAAVVGGLAGGAIALGLTTAGADPPTSPTTTPIKHVVVLYQENISFDHYFGTYPHAVNPAGQTPFNALPGTPAVNGLTNALLTANPNSANPHRIDPQSDLLNILGCDNNHGYSAEQQAFDMGLMDKFVQSTTGGAPCSGSEVLNYFDGNTVTAMWNYAQHFAMSDNSYGTGFGPSTVGALETVSGNTTGMVDDAGAPIAATAGVINNNTAYSNSNPFDDYDGCSAQGASSYAGSFATSGPNWHKNVGDLLNAANVTWGWFQGGFTPTSRQGATATFPHGRPVCGSAHENIAHALVGDYDAHHNPFAYYKSTANPEHLAPTAAIGTTDQANHQYDLTDFNAAVAADNLPSVSFVKAGHYQDGHAGYSDPLDEQTFLAQTINRLESLPTWKSTAVIISYDDSDGWYDHQLGPVISGSQTPLDALTGVGQCSGAPAPITDAGLAEEARCGVGVRMPFLVVSPLAKRNYIDHTLTDQSSIVRFIEDNWLSGERLGNGAADAPAGSIDGMFDFAHQNARQLFLDPSTGEPTS